MVQALIIFGYFLFLSAVTLFIFWVLQIRYGDVSDLDPQGIFVKWFARKQLSSVQNPVSSGSGTVILSDRLAAAVVATVICLTISTAPSGVRADYFMPEQRINSSASPAMPRFICTYACAR